MKSKRIVVIGICYLLSQCFHQEIIQTKDKDKGAKERLNDNQTPTPAPTPAPAPAPTPDVTAPTPAPDTDKTHVVDTKPASTKAPITTINTIANQAAVKTTTPAIEPIKYPAVAASKAAAPAAAPAAAAAAAVAAAKAATPAAPAAASAAAVAAAAAASAAAAANSIPTSGPSNQKNRVLTSIYIQNNSEKDATLQQVIIVAGSGKSPSLTKKCNINIPSKKSIYDKGSIVTFDITTPNKGYTTFNGVSSITINGTVISFDHLKTNISISNPIKITNKNGAWVQDAS